MDDVVIRKAWYELEKYFGPDYYGRNAYLKNNAQTYAKAILDSDDRARIKYIGKRHLKLVADKFSMENNSTNFYIMLFVMSGH